MTPINFPEATLFLGRPSDMSAEACDALPVARVLVNLPGGEVADGTSAYPAVVSCWQPSDEERAAIAAGGPIYLHLIGPTMQPAIVATQMYASEVVGSN